jgi:hypothetical protein
MDRNDILLMRLALVEVRAMVCLTQETYRTFAFQTSPELAAPRLSAGTTLLVCEPPT